MLYNNSAKNRYAKPVHNKTIKIFKIRGNKFISTKYIQNYSLMLLFYIYNTYISNMASLPCCFSQYQIKKLSPIYQGLYQLLSLSLSVCLSIYLCISVCFLCISSFFLYIFLFLSLQGVGQISARMQISGLYQLLSLYPSLGYRDRYTDR